jgi:hypothetical protein
MFLYPNGLILATLLDEELVKIVRTYKFYGGFCSSNPRFFAGVRKKLVALDESMLLFSMLSRTATHVTTRQSRG